MKAFQKADGGALMSIREYDIAASTAISEGQLVKITAGLVVSATASDTGRLLGVAAENHSGAADALDPRANGTKIRVIDCPDAIFECPVPVFTATGGSATTVTANTLGAFANDDFNGGYLKLISKGANSANADPIGTVKRIADYGYNSTGTVSTFTVASGASAGEGDKFELYPPVGFAKGNYDSSIQKLILTATASLTMKVVGRDEDAGVIRMMIAQHVLGGEE